MTSLNIFVQITKMFDQMWYAQILAYAQADMSGMLL